MKKIVICIISLWVHTISCSIKPDEKVLSNAPSSAVTSRTNQDSQSNNKKKNVSFANELANNKPETKKDTLRNVDPHTNVAPYPETRFFSTADGNRLCSCCCAAWPTLILMGGLITLFAVLSSGSNSNTPTGNCPDPKIRTENCTMHDHNQNKINQFAAMQAQNNVRTIKSLLSKKTYKLTGHYRNDKRQNKNHFLHQPMPRNYKNNNWKRSNKKG